MDLLRPYLEQYFCDGLQQLVIPSQGVIESPMRSHRQTLQIIKWLTFEKSDGSGGSRVSGILTDGIHNVLAVFDNESVKSYRERYSRRITNETKLFIITLKRYNIRFRSKHETADSYGLQTPLRFKAHLTPVLYVQQIVDVYPSLANQDSISSKKVISSPSIKAALLQLEHDLYAKFDLFSPQLHEKDANGDEDTPKYHPGWDGFHLLRAQDCIIPRDQLAGMSEDSWYKSETKQILPVQLQETTEQELLSPNPCRNLEDTAIAKPAGDTTASSNPTMVLSAPEQARRQTNVNPIILKPSEDQNIGNDDRGEWSSSPPSHSARGMDLVPSQLEPGFETQFENITEDMMRETSTPALQSENNYASLSQYNIPSDVSDESPEKELNSPASSPSPIKSLPNREGPYGEDYDDSELSPEDNKDRANSETESSSSEEHNSPSQTLTRNSKHDQKEGSAFIQHQPRKKPTEYHCVVLEQMEETVPFSLKEEPIKRRLEMTDSHNSETAKREKAKKVEGEQSRKGDKLNKSPPSNALKQGKSSNFSPRNSRSYFDTPIFKATVSIKTEKPSTSPCSFSN